MGSNEPVSEAVHSIHGKFDPLVAPADARRFSATISEPVLLRAARAGEVRFAVTFGGQGAEWLQELRDLHASHMAVRTLVQACTERLRASSRGLRRGR